MNSKRIAFVALFVGVCMLPMAHAAGRCPAGESGCNIENGADKIRERVNDGARSVLKNTNEGGRLKEVKETVKDCMKCGIDAIKDGVAR